MRAATLTTRSSPAVAAEEPGTTPTAILPRLRLPALLLAVGVLAFAVRFAFLARGGGLLGWNGYDDGVYYAAADALVHGRLPYRDFLFLQPPGIVVLLTPFAWLGSLTSDPTGVLASRLAFMAIGGVNAALVAAICRRFGWAAALTGGLVYAVFFPAVYSERSALLEPIGTLGVLVALLLLPRRHSSRVALLVAGAALGVGLTTKIWYVVPAVLIAVFAGRRWWLVVAGAAGATAVLCLPFFLADPAVMFRQVVSDQLGRPVSQLWTPLRRVESFLGVLSVSPPTSASDAADAVLVWVVLAVVLGLAALALTVRGARLFPLLALATATLLLLTPSYFDHYASLVAPSLALTAGVGTARLARRLPARPLHALVAGAVVLAAVALSARGDLHKVSAPFPAAALRAGVDRVRGCVTSDDPGVLALVDVLTRDLRQGCTVWVDVTGHTYDRDLLRLPNGRPVRRVDNPRWQRDVRQYLMSGNAAILYRRSTGLSDATKAAIHRGGALVTSGTLHLWAIDHSSTTTR